jgi:WD40 repeat protein
VQSQNAASSATSRSAEDELANLTLDDSAAAAGDDDDDAEAGRASESTTSDAGSWKPRRTLKRYDLPPVSTSFLRSIADPSLLVCCRPLTSHVDAVRDVACHPEELCIASASDDCTVKLWRLDFEELTSDKCVCSACVCVCRELPP